MIVRLYNRYVSVLFLLAVLMWSCTDDIVPGAAVEEGLYTRINLKISTPEMPQLTSRADMSQDDLFRVNSLWVGIFNVNTGNVTYSHLFTDGDSGFTSGVKNHNEWTLNNITTRSGMSYIVAVANPDVNDGYKLNASGEPGAAAKLSELLAGVSSWTDFRSIVIERGVFQNAAVLSEPQAPMTMSGVYYEGTSDPADWTAVKPAAIPEAGQDEKVTLSGMVHLRRPYSQVKFNVSVEPGSDIVDINVESFYVRNVPTYSWLYERSQSADAPAAITDYANAGDAMQPDASKNRNYPTSLSNVAPVASAGVTSFDFWMMENKRTGRSEFFDGVTGENAYQKREIEYKNGNKNTGVYESLCSTETATLNNNATYVEIYATVTYRDGNNLDNPEEIGTGDGTGTLPDEVQSRTAEVVYIVHLGYINNVATDFNNLRNSIYTYNVRVRTANSVILEAFRMGERQPGAAGTVTDVTDRLEHLDAHSGVFNIYLTQEEIKNFSFTMRSYYNGEEHVIQQFNDGTGNIPEKDSEEFRFYDWIEFVPTGITGQSTANERRLALYPDLTAGGDVVKYYAGELRTSEERGQYFTVYVNENAYVPRYGDTDWGNEVGNDWHAYVNQKPRQAWFNVSQETSDDGESVYYRSKYALTQQSIQTYYNLDDTDISTALGIEHTNETFGMNMRWTSAVGSDGLDPDNGRYNVWLKAGGRNGGSTAGRWNEYLTMNALQSVNAMTNRAQMQYAADYFNTASGTYNVPHQVLITSGLNGTAGFYNGVSSEYDPQISGNSRQYVESMFACMNRNRDENGNGIIDAPELKWYVPASGKYVRMILGRRTLAQPLMDYQQGTLTYACTNGGNTLYHFITSDNIIVWADEPMSSSSFYGSANQYSYAPWQVRCIRNLGTDLTSVSSGEKVEAAYYDKDKDADTGGGVVKIRAYYGTALRENRTTPLPMHKSNSINNALGRYGFEIAVKGNGISASNEEATVTFANSNAGFTRYQNSVNDATPCATLNQSSGRTGWRVPNQSEVVIMRRMGILSDNGNTTSQFMTCTQEYYSNATPAVGSGDVSRNYRILTVRTSLATAQEFNGINVVRCVRDLTASEANKSYNDIVNNR